jgi:hypothetical protein
VADQFREDAGGRQPYPQLYRHAEECARSAEKTGDPRRRPPLLELVVDWRRDAQACSNQRQPNTDGTHWEMAAPGSEAKQGMLLARVKGNDRRRE